MTDHVRDEISKWREELELEKRNNVGDVNEAVEKISVVRAKYYVAERALNSFDNAEERKKFYEENVKPLEEALDKAEEYFETIKYAKGMRNAHIDLLLAQIEINLTS
ncbi:hypothetical protein ACJ2A9_11030 [Anaerobacillus sp. MEB173]|uniref:hypothetical protein n=1 Tax=Anaerobacillus sp. MEB173 TaxID=3383345 RepID=UPI003F925755